MYNLFFIKTFKCNKQITDRVHAVGHCRRSVYIFRLRRAAKKFVGPPIFTNADVPRPAPLPVTSADLFLPDWSARYPLRPSQPRARIATATTTAADASGRPRSRQSVSGPVQRRRRRFAPRNAVSVCAVCRASRVHNSVCRPRSPLPLCRKNPAAAIS